MPYFETAATRHTTRRVLGAKAALLALGAMTLLPPAQAYAQEGEVRHQVFTTTYSAASSISGNALSGVTGAVNVNIASGDRNLQSNSGAIAIGSNALANNIVVQQITGDSALEPDRASVRIGDNALSQSAGWISVNQAAGARNVQSNTMSVALGVRGSSLTSENLSQVLSGGSGQEQGSDDSRSSRRDVEVETSAFRGTTGVVQVNQSAGRGNASSNSFRFRMGQN
ncbi:hypothetical protein HOP54_14495 [Halomonas daqingensis]|uniref:hypothetical protein n=1 Tax=Billgrantia desiderata TaxID=52021 RepID=UPI001F24CC70|nr:hypothetical protein [Halomonas desiderata]MCE8029900.1 hypothetical protein [Halomonas desiderata]